MDEQSKCKSYSGKSPWILFARLHISALIHAWQPESLSVGVYWYAYCTQRHQYWVHSYQFSHNSLLFLHVLHKCMLTMKQQSAQTFSERCFAAYVCVITRGKCFTSTWHSSGLQCLAFSTLPFLLSEWWIWNMNAQWHDDPAKWLPSVNGPLTPLFCSHSHTQIHTHTHDNHPLKWRPIK